MYLVPYNSGVIVLVISNQPRATRDSPDYSLNCTPLSPITITFDDYHKMYQSGTHLYIARAALSGVSPGTGCSFNLIQDKREFCFSPKFSYRNVLSL